MNPHENETTIDDRPGATATRSTHRRWLVGGLLAAGALLGIGTAAAIAGDDDAQLRAAPPTVDVVSPDEPVDTAPMPTTPDSDEHDHTHSHDHDHEGDSCDCGDAIADDEPEVDDATVDDDVDETADGGDTGDDADDDWFGDDPFEGMTDAEIDALSDEEFEQILEDAGWTLEDDLGEDDLDEDGDHDDWEELAPLASFEIEGGRIDLAGVGADIAEVAERIWTRFTELIPVDQREMLVRFELLSADEGGHVYPDEDDPTRWVMGIGSDLGDDEDYVIIHEFAHLLTLQAEEVPPADDDGTCPTYHTGEGCALSGSTFAGFVARFWPEELLERLEQDGPEAVYDDDPSQFVTDYAASNPAEDLAEVFTAFVLDERPEGDTVADQKVQFLWDDPAMVALRDQIRANL